MPNNIVFMQGNNTVKTAGQHFAVGNDRYANTSYVILGVISCKEWRNEVDNITSCSNLGVTGLYLMLLVA